MKVSELIEVLKKADPDAPVVIDSGFGDADLIDSACYVQVHKQDKKTRAVWLCQSDEIGYLGNCGNDSPETQEIE